MTSGTRLLVTSDADSFEIVSDLVRPIGPGEIVLVLPGQSGRINLPDGSIVRLPAPALVALDTYADQPRVMVGRGYVRIESPGGQPVAVNAGGQKFTVEGIAEFDVHEPSPHHAFQWTSQTFQTAAASLISMAYADTDSDDLLRARVTAHAIQGRVLPQVPGGKIILTGQASSFGPDRPDEGPEAFGGQSVFEPAPNILTDSERASLARVLGRTRGDRTELLDLADQTDGPESDQDRQMAVWLMGEMGVKDAARQLELVIGSRAPTCVRSAAVAALAKVSSEPSALWALANDLGIDPALADAALFACARMNFAGTGKQLRKVLENSEQPELRRIHAAALLWDGGYPLVAGDLAGFLGSEVRSAAALAVDLMVKLPGGDSGIAGVISDVEPWLAARILERLARVRTSTDAVIRYARDVLDETTGDPDPAAQVRFRASLRFLRTNGAEGLEDSVSWAIRNGEPSTRQVALSSLLWGRTDESLGDLDEGLREHLEALLRDPKEPAELRTIVFPLFRSRADILADLRDDPSPEVNAKARSRLLGADMEGGRRELALETLDHELLDARTAAWCWLATHEPDELLTRAEMWLAAHATGDVDAIANALDRAFGSDEPARPLAELDRDLWERAAKLAEAILDRPPSRNATDVVVAGVIGNLAKAGSPRARSACRDLALAGDRPTALRLPAALSLARYARTDAEIEAVARILRDADVDLAADTAQSFTSARSPAELVLALRRSDLHPRVRAYLALSAPFDADYARGVLTAGDNRANRNLLRWIGPDEVDQVRAAVAERLSDPEVGIRLLSLRLLAPGEGNADLPASIMSDPDPWVRVMVLATRVIRGAEPEAEAIVSAVRAADAGNRKRLERALKAFAESPTTATAQTLLYVSKDAPEAWTPRHEDAPSADHLRSLESSRGRQRGLALSRLDAKQSAPSMWFAVDALKKSGGRKHLALLFEIAADTELDAAVRRVAIRSAGSLLARELDVADPGPALDELERWWRDRAFALVVPVLPRSLE